MDIIKTNIKNFRAISDVEFEFNDSLNVFVGVNGSGKTTILDSLITSLSWLINRIQRENVSGKHISENDIRNNEPYSTIETFIKSNGQIFNWKLVKTRKGETTTEKSQLSEVSRLADFFRIQLKKSKKLPVIAYYPVNRVVKDISPEISSKDNFYILDVYENAIGPRANFQSFFEWFRLQDDILNENLGSRTKWIISNKKWLKRKTNKIVSYLAKITKDYDEYKFLTERLKNNDIIYEEPRYLFHELIDILHSIEIRFEKEHDFEMVLHDIEYLLHKMSSLSDLRKDNLIEPSKFPTHIIERIFKQLERLFDKINFENEIKPLIQFIWETLLFSILLSFWWLSDKGKREIETLFKNYNPILKKNQKEWDKNTETFIKDIEQIVRNDANRQDMASKNQGREIQIVARTIENFIEGYSNLRIKRVPHPHMLVDKNEDTFNLEQLSHGEKNLIALVGDIARRLSISNPNSEKPLKGDGIILIDEVDLHLHPAWQRLIIPKLTELFPNCQFFITTHSPQVLSHVKPKNIFLLKNKNNELSWTKPEESYGKNTDRILEDILGVTSRPQKTKKDLQEVFKLIEENKLDEALKSVAKIENEIGSDSELAKARVLIKRKEIIGK